MTNKTEKPTPKRVGEARKKGQVARSMELNSAASLLMGVWLLTGPGKRLLVDLQSIVIETVTSLPTVAERGVLPISNIAPDMLRIATDLGIIVMGLLATGVIVTMVQTRFNIASESLKIDLTRINPLNGLKRLLSPRGLVEVGKSLLKLALVGWMTYSFLQPRLDELLGLSQMDLRAAIQWWGSMARGLVVRVGAAYFVLAIIDYVYQRWDFMRSMKMTKEEVKDERKQQEGDPKLKARIRGQQLRMAQMRMMANVPKADVVITNPTHLAIAVQYNQQSMQSPKVVAKGANRVAERIVALARASSIPVVQNIPLARSLYLLVDIGQEIPPDLYVAMAEMLAYVYGMQGREPNPVPA